MTRPGKSGGSGPAGPGAGQAASTWAESLLADSSSGSLLDVQGSECDRVAVP